MAEEPTSTLTKKSVFAAKSLLSPSTAGVSTGSTSQFQSLTALGHLLAVAGAIVAALLSSFGGDGVQLLEKQVPSIFFQLRGSIPPPEDIVILAIDDQSISMPEQYYKTNPQQYAYLEPLKSFPYKRQAYAQIITRLMEAGVQAVALDIVFDQPSSYGEADDLQLQTTLQKYGSKVTLAAIYENSQTHQGEFLQLTQPQPKFSQNSVSVGFVNFSIELDGKIHSLGGDFIRQLNVGEQLTNQLPSFAEATLRAAKVRYSPPKGKNIYFWGNGGTFNTIPLWYVLDEDNWNGYLQQGRVFKDKIVLIGATAKLSQDFHPVAGSSYADKMPGVEIHANAIATLMQNKAIAPAIPSPQLNSLFVLLLVGSSAFIASRSPQGTTRLLFSLLLAGVWGGISYFSFIQNQVVFATAVPMIAIAGTGICYLGVEVAAEKMKKQQWLMVFKKYQSSPVVQEILSQSEELQDIIKQKDLALQGKILKERYKILKVLGAGGFSETYIAEDLQRPDHPQCVVKQLKPANTKSESLELARRLFNSEAKTLEKLGTHNQIPYLLAYFEEGEEFYLIQELIVGHPLGQELPVGQSLNENAVIDILKDLLQILVFVHSNSVIHRDIKPNNIIRREADGKLVLIDFGAVKEVSTQIIDSQEQSAFTIGIGTKGYASSEQCFGRPQYNSDIHAVGMIGIRALTGIPPHELSRDIDGEVKWTHKAQVSKPLAAILSKMVLDDYHQRYQTASEVLADLNNLPVIQEEVNLSPNYQIGTLNIEDDYDNPTTPWV